jgi:hypothetical protein
MAEEETEEEEEEEEELEDELEPGQQPLEIEPEDDDATTPWSKVAAPDRKLVTQPYDLAVSELVAQITNEELHLNPVYQRRYVWDDVKASKLIESLLINVPIPVIYLAEEDDGTRSTIDGQQRLRSIHRYLDNQFSLKGLDVLTELNGSRFHELSQTEQRLIRKRAIRCIVIGEESHPDIRFDVFERLNTGSVALTSQEIRNSAYRGSFNEALHELADLDIFRRCLSNRANTRMASEELVLRFFALDESLVEYRPSLKLFLSHYMRDNRGLDEDALAAKRHRFIGTTEKVYAVFEGNSFKRAVIEGKKISWLSQINSALYDVVMLNFARLLEPPEELRQHRARIRSMTARLTARDKDFADAISLATGDRARLHRRVAMYSQALAALGFDSGLASQIEALADGE